MQQLVIRGIMIPSAGVLTDSMLISPSGPFFFVVFLVSSRFQLPMMVVVASLPVYGILKTLG
jgi:hypothetical protein